MRKSQVSFPQVTCLPVHPQRDALPSGVPCALHVWKRPRKRTGCQRSATHWVTLRVKPDRRICSFLSERLTLTLRIENSGENELPACKSIKKQHYAAAPGNCQNTVYSVLLIGINYNFHFLTIGPPEWWKELLFYLNIHYVIYKKCNKRSQGFPPQLAGETRPPWWTLFCAMIFNSHTLLLRLSRFT